MAGFGNLVGMVARETFRFTPSERHYCHVSTSLTSAALSVLVYLFRLMLGTALLMVLCAVWLMVGLVKYVYNLRKSLRAQYDGQVPRSR